MKYVKFHLSSPILRRLRHFQLRMYLNFCEIIQVARKPKLGWTRGLSVNLPLLVNIFDILDLVKFENVVLMPEEKEGNFF